ncbi:hypothetical protein ABW19_dt0200820 [Dactylella cylindrospora]|nr:hypothetical protein ABW19_dt0200820 [Dactylella cylindrospora]
MQKYHPSVLRSIAANTQVPTMQSDNKKLAEFLSTFKVSPEFSARLDRLAQNPDTIKKAEEMGELSALSLPFSKRNRITIHFEEYIQYISESRGIKKTRCLDRDEIFEYTCEYLTGIASQGEGREKPAADDLYQRRASLARAFSHTVVGFPKKGDKLKEWVEAVDGHIQQLCGPGESEDMGKEEALSE